MTSIRTHSGGTFDLANPRPEDVCIDDIAHALSMLCRFTGHCRSFYSVAQHSVLVCDRVKELGGDLTAQRWALLHDAAEAYVGDWSSPLKRAIRELPEEWLDDPGSRRIARIVVSDVFDIDKAVDLAIAYRFGLPPEHPPIVKEADLDLLATEQRDLMNGSGPKPRALPGAIAPWSPERARGRFLWRFEELFGCGPF